MVKICWFNVKVFIGFVSYIQKNKGTKWQNFERSFVKICWYSAKLLYVLRSILWEVEFLSLGYLYWAISTEKLLFPNACYVILSTLYIGLYRNSIEVLLSQGTNFEWTMDYEVIILSRTMDIYVSLQIFILYTFNYFCFFLFQMAVLDPLSLTAYSVMFHVQEMVHWGKILMFGQSGTLSMEQIYMGKKCFILCRKMEDSVQEPFIIMDY